MITCSYCGRQTNPDFDTDSCWGCGKPLPEARASLSSAGQEEIAASGQANTKSTETPAVDGPRGLIWAAVLLSVIFVPFFLLMDVKSPKEVTQQLAANVTRDREAELERLSEQKMDLVRQLEAAEKTCDEGARISDPLGELAMAEFDVAHAESIPTMTSEQEWRTRAAIGAEIGLAPSQVDGWKSILEARARSARAKIEAAETDANRRTQLACSRREEFGQELQKLDASIGEIQLASQGS